jgi:hypothetical protein
MPAPSQICGISVIASLFNMDGAVRVYGEARSLDPRTGAMPYNTLFFRHALHQFFTPVDFRGCAVSGGFRG